MGISFEVFVVKLMGEIWEVEGLFVVDISVFLMVLGVNLMVII